jgi:hypothetical protein
MTIELFQFIFYVYLMVKLFRWLDTIPTYPDPYDTPQDYM